MRRLTALLATASLLVLIPSASATAPERKVIVDSFEIRWGCPGPDPVEQATQTTKKTTFFLGGGLEKIVYHRHWEGWVRHRETGELLRDDGVWTDILYLDGNRLIRAVTTGAVWRFVIPGRGIVVHQSGRSVYVPDGQGTETPFAAIPNLKATLCRYV